MCLHDCIIASVDPEVLSIQVSQFPYIVWVDVFLYGPYNTNSYSSLCLAKQALLKFPFTRHIQVSVIGVVYHMVAHWGGFVWYMRALVPVWAWHGFINLLVYLHSCHTATRDGIVNNNMIHVHACTSLLEVTASHTLRQTTWKGCIVNWAQLTVLMQVSKHRILHADSLEKPRVLQLKRFNLAES